MDDTIRVFDCQTNQGGGGHRKIGGDGLIFTHIFREFSVNFGVMTAVFPTNVARLIVSHLAPQPFPEVRHTVF